MTEKRVPVSITTTSVLENGDVIFVTNVIANDGTMWEYREGDEWIQLPDLPQDDLEEDESNSEDEGFLSDEWKAKLEPQSVTCKVTTPACDKVSCSVKDKQDCSECNDPLVQLLESVFGKSPHKDIFKHIFAQ